MKRAFLIFSLIFTLMSCSEYSLRFRQQIESPDGKYNYCLYTSHGGIGDPAYYVLRLDKSLDPIQVCSDSGSVENYQKWTNNNEILSNYDEAGLYTSNPEIKLINNRFLVLSRGGFYFGLYDIKYEKEVFNSFSPWEDWRSKSGYKSDKYDEGKVEKEYGNWIKANLDDRIKDHIKYNK